MDKTVCNPRALTDLWNGNEIGDPFLMRFDGRFYLYCSSHGGPGIKCWVSEDMESFTYQGFVCEDERVTGAYAPEVMYRAGRFYMVTSPVGSGHYLLVSDGPLGPFAVISENLGLAIDGSMFLDDDGRGYFLRASHEGIRIHDMPAPDAIDPHSRVISESFMGHWTEGPMLIKREGRYFLTFTGNHVLSRGYRVDYCVSRQRPDGGYRRLKENTLLLETRDEFHALGHSSTCVGPDMDTMYIVYHKNILDERNRPDHRSMNLDRLFFNGDRMYCNATWWPQQAPAQPVCACRDGVGMVACPSGLALPKETGDTYTAEINFQITGDEGGVFFSRRNGRGGAVTIAPSGRWTCVIEDDTSREFSGTLPYACDAGALMTVKVSLHKGSLALYVNNLHLLAAQTGLGGGALGILGQCAPGFTGFSDVAKGSGEGKTSKAVPGVWDALHCLEGADAVSGESGCLAARFAPGQTLTYPVNVWRSGRYHLSVTLAASAAPLSLRVNGQPLTAPSVGAANDQGMEKRYLGQIELEGGAGVLTLTADCAAVIDRIFLCAADAFAPAVIVDGGEDVTEGGLRIIGHKARLSMLRKCSGFTCAEGYGEGYFGGAWRDYQVRAVLRVDPCSPDAWASLYLRSSLESWHPHQVAAGRVAYCVRVLPGRIELCRHNYGERTLQGAALDCAYPARLSLVCQAVGNTISVYRETDLGRQQLLCYTDPDALPVGRVGLDARGDGIGFEFVAVEALR